MATKNIEPIAVDCYTSQILYECPADTEAMVIARFCNGGAVNALLHVYITQGSGSWPEKVVDMTLSPQQMFEYGPLYLTEGYKIIVGVPVVNTISGIPMGIETTP